MYNDLNFGGELGRALGLAGAIEKKSFLRHLETPRLWRSSTIQISRMRLGVYAPICRALESYARAFDSPRNMPN